MGFTKGNACKIMFVQRFILTEEMKDNIGKKYLINVTCVEKVIHIHLYWQYTWIFKVVKHLLIEMCVENICT